MKFEGIMNPDPPKCPGMDEPIVEEPEDGSDMPDLESNELLAHNRAGGIYVPDAAKLPKSKNPKKSALRKREEYREKLQQGLDAKYPEYNTDEVKYFIN